MSNQQVEETIQIPLTLWKRIRFLIDGIATMETLRREHPTLQFEFRQISEQIRQGDRL